MSLKIIVGLPGSGKTYYAVNQVVLKYYKWDHDLDEWAFKSAKHPAIFSNIEDLSLDHINIDSYLKKHSITIEQFFTLDFQKKLTEKYKNLVYVIDEAQKYFPSRYYNVDVFYYFQYHRHLGHDIFLITQDVSSLPKQLVSLTEFYISATRSSFRLASEFRYKFISSGEVIGRKMLKTDKRIFALYSSFKIDSDVKTPRPIRRYALYFASLFIVVVFVFYFFVHSLFLSSAHTTSSIKHSPSLNQQAVSVRPRAGAHSHQLASSNVQHPVYPDTLRNSIAKGIRHIKTMPKQFIVLTGGFWQGSHLLYIVWNRKLVYVGDFPYQYVPIPGRLKVRVFVPASDLRAEYPNQVQQDHSQQQSDQSPYSQQVPGSFASSGSASVGSDNVNAKISRIRGS